MNEQSKRRLTDYLEQNPALFSLLAEQKYDEARDKLAADGIKVDSGELTAFVSEMLANVGSVKTSGSGELDEAALEYVMGGTMHPMYALFMAYMGKNGI